MISFDSETASLHRGEEDQASNGAALAVPSARGTPVPQEASKDSVRNAVLRLLEKPRPDEDRRWEPRILYVRPVHLVFSVPRQGVKRSAHCLYGVTTDISTDGAGVLTFEHLPSQHFTLQFPEVWFRCEILWSRKLGHRIYRHGVSFVGLSR